MNNMPQRQPNISPALFFGGLLVGAVLTALYTPKTGLEMRRQLKTNSDRFSENMKSSADDIKQKAKTTKEKAASKLQRDNKENDKDNNNQPPLPPNA